MTIRQMRRMVQLLENIEREGIIFLTDFTVITLEDVEDMRFSEAPENTQQLVDELVRRINSGQVETLFPLDETKPYRFVRSVYRLGKRYELYEELSVVGNTFHTSLAYKMEG